MFLSVGRVSFSKYLTYISLGQHILSGVKYSVLLLAYGAMQRQSLLWPKLGMMGMLTSPWESMVSSLLSGLERSTRMGSWFIPTDITLPRDWSGYLLSYLEQF